MRKNVPRAAALLLLLLAAVPVSAAVPPIPPAPTRWVTDNARWLTDAERTALDARLEAYQRASGHQLLAWIGTTTGDAPTEQWTARAFEAWKVGRAKADDGVVLFVFADDRKVRIEVGYGMEGAVPDATAARIIGDVITPRIKEGRRAEALGEGTDALVAAMGGSVKLPPADPGAAAEAPPPLGPLPLPGRYVTNHSPLFAGEDVEKLEGELAAHARKTGQPLYVWVGPSIRGAEVEGWFAALPALGSGAVLLLGMADPAVRVQFGPNLSGAAYGEPARRNLEQALSRLRGDRLPWEWPGRCTWELLPLLGHKDAPGTDEAAFAFLLGVVLFFQLVLPPFVVGALFRLLAGLWRERRPALLAGLAALAAALAWDARLGMALLVALVGFVRMGNDGGSRGGKGRSGPSGSSSGSSSSGFSGGGGRSGGGGATGSW